MKKLTIQVCQNYGSVVTGVDYPVFSEGYDFYKVKARGKMVYIPKYLESKGLDPAIVQEKMINASFKEKYKDDN